ncbi:uncharacterized protein E0L32_001025 [Thyridium curvatum]|uniref:mRNA export factor MEX67 n=1 Tax=Thyridium curvatum TaxID=1093900 RepID=A0A507AUP2_9PEZI|nr:uncharacterized protein E0L32_001025 [Thyridium curvatum]TPX11207.1 hypothetical protein E0L32_001025 [Thyridium curvatum]
MAPPTGPRNPTTTQSRNTRSTTRGTANTKGAGISKRRSGPSRIDRDGDLTMGAVPAPNGDNKKSATGRGRSGPRTTRQKAVAAAEQKIVRHLGGAGSDLAARISDLPKKKVPVRKVFKVLGLDKSKAANNSDRGERSALEFLEKKASHIGGRKVTIVKSHLDRDFTLFIMINEQDADEIIKVNNFQFAGSTLIIGEVDGGWPSHWNREMKSKPGLSADTKERKAQLQQVLGQRYNIERKLLDLSALGQDPILIGMGYLEDKERAEKTFKVLMAICDETFPTAKAKREAVESVSLANNSIDWVGQVFALAETFPDLKHLDLSGNQFNSLKSLGRWRGQFRDLETLLLNENPIQVAEPNHQAEVLEWFPKLTTLSNVQVRTPEQIAAMEAAKAASRPSPLPQHGADFRDQSGIAEAFLTQFIPMYDSDRTQLASFCYDETSTFSLSVTTHTPRNQGEAVLPWAAYLRYSRNLTKITHTAARVQRLVRGAKMISEMWKTLPVTKHPDLKTEFGKYIVDCHPLSGIPDPSGNSPMGVDGLIISLHGEFEEIDPSSGKTGKRSFTRTFVLGPGAPGQSPIRVVSDLLSLRAHSPVPQATPTSSEMEQKQQMVAELSKQTNMNPQYSEMCLNEVGWDFTKALAKFAEIRPNLGPEVFMATA